jgi:hypothetical protein
VTIQPLTGLPVRYIQRSPDHQYTFDGVTYPGVTDQLKVLDRSGPLMAWAARMTAEAAVAMAGTLPLLIETSGADGAIKALTARHKAKNEDAKLLGTDVHAIADLIASGRPVPAMSETVLKRVDGYERWLRESGWRIRCSEGMVINTAKGYGGTLDLLAYDREGKTVLADIKTGTVTYAGKVYDSIVMQLGAYGDAEWLDMGDGKLYAMPTVDRYAVIHVTEEGTTELPVTVGPPDLGAFRACMDLTRWLKYRKGLPRLPKEGRDD